MTLLHVCALLLFPFIHVCVSQYGGTGRGEWKLIVRSHSLFNHGCLKGVLTNCEPASQRVMRVEPASHASHASHHVSHARQMLVPSPFSFLRLLAAFGYLARVFAILALLSISFCYLPSSFSSFVKVSLFCFFVIKFWDLMFYLWVYSQTIENSCIHLHTITDSWQIDVCKASWRPISRD